MWIVDCNQSLVIAAVLAAVACGADVEALPEGRGLMEDQIARHEADSEYARAKMTLFDANSRSRERILHSWSAKQDGLSRMLTKFSEPADIHNVGTLTWEQPGDREDDQWLYLPDLKRVKRVTGGSKKNLYMGTDLAFEDLRPEDTDVHTYRTLRDELFEGNRCWVIECLPATDEEKKNSGYTRRLIWLDREHLRVLRTDYFGAGGKKIKTAVARDWRQVKGTLWRPGVTEVSRLTTGTRTRIQLTRLEIDQGVDPVLLTRMGLERPLSLQ